MEPHLKSAIVYWVAHATRADTMPRWARSLKFTSHDHFFGLSIRMRERQGVQIFLYWHSIALPHLYKPEVLRLFGFGKIAEGFAA